MKMATNIYKRKDGRFEGRYANGYKPDGKTKYGSVFGKTYDPPVANATADVPVLAAPAAQTPPAPQGNDFNISADELAGIEFVPSVNRMQTVSHGGLVKGNRVNFKAILAKGILWAFIGAVLGFGISEALDNATSSSAALRMMGQPELADVQDFIREYDYDQIGDGDLAGYTKFLNDFGELNDRVTLSDKQREAATTTATRVSSAFFAMFLALGLGLFLGVGEGVFYGSKEKAVRHEARRY